MSGSRLQVAESPCLSEQERTVLDVHLARHAASESSPHRRACPGDYPGLVASGRSFSIPGVTVVVRQNGKIVRESLYYDMNEVQRQLGSR